MSAISNFKISNSFVWPLTIRSKSVCFVIVFLGLRYLHVTVTNSVLIIPQLAQPNYQTFKIFSGIYIVSYYVNLNFLPL